MDLIKKVFSDDKYSGKLHDKKDIPFIVYHAYFTNSEELFHCYKLHELLNDEMYRQHLIKEFGYDVDNYRKEYSLPGVNLSKNTPVKKGFFKTIKLKINSKRNSNLSFLELLFLLIRRIFHIVTLSRFRHKKRKKYSL